MCETKTEAKGIPYADSKRWVIEVAKPSETRLGGFESATGTMECIKY